jgi:hypothetical protein
MRLQRPNLVRTEVAAIRDACDRRGIRVFLFLDDEVKSLGRVAWA